MNSNERLAIVLPALLVAYLIPLRLILWRFLPPFARQTLVVLTLLLVVWGTANSLTRWDQTFWGWLFASNTELAFGAMCSSLQLMLVALVALLNARIALNSPSSARRFARRLPWFILAASFLFMSLDEYYSIHESSDLWNTLYSLNGITLGLMAVAIYALERDFTAPLFLVIGVAMMGFGGVVLDEYSNEVPISFAGVEIACHYKVQGMFCTDLSIIEELFEMGGAGLILVGFIAHAEKRPSPPRWKRALAAAAAVWSLWMIGSLWIAPTIEAKVMADPVTVEYLDGVLKLESYRLSDDTASASDTVEITLFFRAREMLDEDYYLSVHLLAHPDIQSIAQADVPLGNYDYPTSAWLPYVAVKSTVKLSLPRELPSHASYWIMIRVWKGPSLSINSDQPIIAEADGVRIPITQTDRQLLTPDSVILASLAVLGRPPVKPPTTAADYRFSNGIRLYGYDLPTSAAPDQAITLRFWWKTDREINQALTQFIHLYPEDGGPDFYTFDQEPFGGSFPFIDWPDNLDTDDTRRIVLPADIPPGVYRVHTGIYDQNTVTRVTVKDETGNPVQDSSIFLGTLTVTE